MISADRALLSSLCGSYSRYSLSHIQHNGSNNDGENVTFSTDRFDSVYDKAALTMPNGLDVLTFSSSDGQRMESISVDAISACRKPKSDQTMVELMLTDGTLLLVTPVE